MTNILLKFKMSDGRHLGVIGTISKQFKTNFYILSSYAKFKVPNLGAKCHFRNLISVTMGVGRNTIFYRKGANQTYLACVTQLCLVVCVVNRVNMGGGFAAQVPFGGYKMSGQGRE